MVEPKASPALAAEGLATEGLAAEGLEVGLAAGLAAGLAMFLEAGSLLDVSGLVRLTELRPVGLVRLPGAGSGEPSDVVEAVRVRSDGGVLPREGRGYGTVMTRMISMPRMTSMTIRGRGRLQGQQVSIMITSDKGDKDIVP